MTIAQLQVLVNQDVPRAAGEGVSIGWKGNKRGEACVVDFYTEMMLEGRGFQVRAGTVTTPFIGDVPLADTAAEMSVDCPQGLLVLGIYANISVRLGTGTVHEYAIKSVDAVSTGGDVFIALPMLGDTNAVAAQATCRADAVGGVAVSAEAATATARHWSISNPIAVAAGHSVTSHNWDPRTPPAIANNACLYMQIGATGTGPSYYAHIDFLEMPWANVS